MSYKCLNTCLGLRKEVYIEECISSVEQYLLDMRNSRGKGVMIEYIDDGDVVK